jgi:hypothetical protein
MEDSASIGWKVTVTAVAEPLSERYAVAESTPGRAVNLIRRRKEASIGELLEVGGKLSEEDLVEIGLKIGQYCRLSGASRT